MKVNQVIQKLKQQEILNGEIEYKALSGGTSSSITLITDQAKHSFIIKENEQKVIKAESAFLQQYNDITLFPRVEYVDPDYHYFVYAFIEGEMITSSIDKRISLLTLIENVVNLYERHEEANEWGYVAYEVSSWNEFLQNEVDSAEEIMQGDVVSKSDIALVREIAHNLQKISDKRKPYQLHGDCGFHNFIFSHDKIEGVIDPIPLIGDPIHDVIYAYCSTPKQLTKEIMDELAVSVATWDEDNQSLYRYVLIGLFVRLSRCYLHHPQDMETYLKAWDYWKDIVQHSK